MIRLGVASHDQGWSQERNEEEINTWINNNTDLNKEDENGNAKRDLRKMMNPMLKGYLSTLEMLAKERMDLEKAGVNLRHYHQLVSFIDRALKHPKGVGMAIQEIKHEISKLKSKTKPKNKP
jgi:hypothetical protein